MANFSSTEDRLIYYFFVFALVFAFWSLISVSFEDFYRDDNVGGSGPVYVDIGKKLRNFESPSHTYFLGGGGGTYISPVLSGIYEPFVALPAMFLNEFPSLMMNMILSLHLALFATGGWFMGSAVGAPIWARLTAALSLSFSGYFFVWGGNWIGAVLSFAFIPWALGGILKVVNASDRRSLIYAEIILGLALMGLFTTGLFFAAYFGGLVAVTLIAHILIKYPGVYKKLIVRLIPQGLIFVVLIVPLLIQQRELYEYLGPRNKTPVDWILFAVPLQAYLGLLLPNTYSIWRGPFYPQGITITNILMMAGIAPAWYLLAKLLCAPRVFVTKTIMPILIGLGVLVIFLSPHVFGLADFFANVPVINDFRWPFRGIPAFHTLFILLFLLIALEESTLTPKKQALIPALCALTCIVALGIEFNRAYTPSSMVRSWYNAAPRLDDKETWKASTLDALRSSGYVINVCRSEAFFHQKPRIFIYGNMGAQMRIPTVHLYAAPRPKAYAALGMTIKGCITDLENVKEIIEQGPQRPPVPKPVWSGRFGPENFYEIVAKTYVGAAIVENGHQAALDYFLAAPGWEVIEKRGPATAFVRK